MLLYELLYVYVVKAILEVENPEDALLVHHLELIPGYIPGGPIDYTLLIQLKLVYEHQLEGNGLVLGLQLSNVVVVHLTKDVVVY